MLQHWGIFLRHLSFALKKKDEITPPQSTDLGSRSEPKLCSFEILHLFFSYDSYLWLEVLELNFLCSFMYQGWSIIYFLNQIFTEFQCLVELRRSNKTLGNGSPSKEDLEIFALTIYIVVSSILWLSILCQTKIFPCGIPRPFIWGDLLRF